MQTPSEEQVTRDYTHQKKRIYCFRPRDRRVYEYLRQLLLVLFSLCLLFSGIQITQYISEYYASQQVSQELRDQYYAEMTAAPATPPVSPAASPLPTVSAAPTATPPQALALTAVVEPVQSVWLDLASYPNNPFQVISSRFDKLRRQNDDIIGWLNINGILDEAVVQRDNEYYLRRDYLGYHNNNGAVFLEETCDLSSRPYTLMLYAHNMKTGAMFGVLRNYENISYYRNAPFITFDTIYEDGAYVIFSVATLNLNSQQNDYFDFGKLNSRSVSNREEMIRQLQLRSIFQVDIDVVPSDQILMLITCTGDDDERRVIAARRLRENETQESLLRIVQHSRNRR